MVDFNSFTSVLNYVHTSGYVLIFIAMIFIGSPIVTVAAFAATLGYLNFFFVPILAFLADCTEATLFYILGYFGRRRLIGGYGSFFGIKVKALYKLETHFQNNFSKTLFFIKMTPFLSIPGLTLAGFSQIPIKRYALWNIIISFFRAILFSLIGFILGLVASSFLKGKPLAIYLFVLVLIMILLSWLGKHFMEKFFKKELSLESVEFFSHKFYNFLKNKFGFFKKLERKIKSYK